MKTSFKKAMRISFKVVSVSVLYLALKTVDIY
jgi:hypothetical protein